MLSVRIHPPVTAGILIICLVALAGCNPGSSSSSSGLTAPSALSYPVPAPLIQGLPIAPLLPALTGGAPTLYEVSPALPAGLSLNATSGEITGTPSAVTPLDSYRVRASNAAGFVEFVIQLVVDPPAPCGLAYLLTDATYVVGQPITRNLPSLGCGPADAFSVAPPLPAGLDLDALTGEISGTPSAVAALATFTVTASNVTGSDSIDLTITVDPEAPCGLAYSDPAPIYTDGTAITPNTASSACGPADDWSISPALPAGLTLDPTTGTISGTPAQTLAATLFTVTGQNASGSDTVDLTITIERAAPCTLAYSSPVAAYELDLPITPNLPTVGCGLADSFAVTPALPAGLDLDLVTGEITGTPTALAAAADYTVTASNVSGSVSAIVTIEIVPQAPCQLTYAFRNVVYLQGIAIAPNTPSVLCGTPTAWSILPALPAGLQLDAVTGEITGTPSVLSSLVSYIVTASNPTGSDSESITITINPQAPCNLTYSDLIVTYTDGALITPNVPTFGCGPVTLFSIAPALPAGLAISPATGVISGTPAGPSPAANYTVTASNVTGSDSVTLSIAVVREAPCNLTYSNPAAVYQLDLPITPNTAAAGCGPPTDFSVLPALPAGLLLDAVTGTISGTPTSIGAPSAHTITASNITGSTTATITIEVVPQPPCSLAYSDSAPTYIDQTPITANIASFGCGAPDLWTIAPALPSGLALDPATGAITGTPAGVTPATSFAVTASNATGSATVGITITVDPLAPCNLTYADLSPTYLAGLPITPNLPSTGCGTPSSWSVSPALPAGLSLDNTNGEISGTPQTPTAVGTFTVTASNVTGSVSVALAIDIDPQAPCNLTYEFPTPIYLVGSPIVLNHALFSCGTPDSFAISPPLPSGLSLSATTGTIQGIPTAVQPATVHTVTASNVTGSDTTTLTITVNPPAPCGLVYSAPVATYTVGLAITPNQPSFACGTPDTWSIAPALPAGLALSATGVIDGTPDRGSADRDLHRHRFERERERYRQSDDHGEPRGALQPRVLRSELGLSGRHDDHPEPPELLLRNSLELQHLAGAADGAEFRCADG